MRHFTHFYIYYFLWNIGHRQFNHSFNDDRAFFCAVANCGQMNTEKKTVLNTGICFHQIWLLQMRNIVAACSSINRWLDACYFMMCHREVSLHTACCFLLFFRKSCGSCCLWVGCCVGTVFCAHMLLGQFNLPRQETQTWQRYIICEIKIILFLYRLCFPHAVQALGSVKHLKTMLALCKYNWIELNIK